MGDLKYKTRVVNPLSAFADGLSTIIDKGQDLVSDAKDILEDKRIQMCSLSLSTINVLVSSDPLLASFKLSTKQFQMMFPRKRRGYTIDYSNPFHEPCPTYKCKTYHVKETSSLVWCPLCMDFLKVHG